MDYKNKYLKYKNKYSQLKFGGSSSKLTPSNRLSVDFRDLRIRTMNHECISRLSKFKIVATPHSGLEMSTIHELWKKLDENEKDMFKKRFFNKPGETVEIVTYEMSEARQFTSIIFYIVEYLELLAIASEKTIEELLNIFEVSQADNRFNMDLIRIAFGDIFGNDEYDDGQLETEEGQLVLAKYFSLLPLYCY